MMDTEYCFEYDVALSFAGEDRLYVEQVADALRAQSYRVFYDKYEESDLWGKNLYDHLAEVYSKKARLCVMFISANYVRKLWTTHERKHAQARALKESEEYILPARFDDTEIPGLPDTVGYVSLVEKSPVDVARLVAMKLQRPPQKRTPSSLGFLTVTTRALSMNGRSLLTTMVECKQAQRSLPLHLARCGCSILDLRLSL